MKRSQRHCLIVICVGLWLALQVGCNNGPPLGTVTGTVTFEGKPIELARVTFTPDNGRMSVSETAADGSYELRFADGRPGAELGEHLVAIETYRIGSDGNGGIIEHPETLPAKYNVESELSRTVGSGAQVFDFALTKK